MPVPFTGFVGLRIAYQYKPQTGRRARLRESARRHGLFGQTFRRERQRAPDRRRGDKHTARFRRTKAHCDPPTTGPAQPATNAGGKPADRREGGTPLKECQPLAKREVRYLCPARLPFVTEYEPPPGSSYTFPIETEKRWPNFRQKTR